LHKSIRVDVAADADWFDHEQFAEDFHHVSRRPTPALGTGNEIHKLRRGSKSIGKNHHVHPLLSVSLKNGILDASGCKG
jgi:hypothetical protein